MHILPHLMEKKVVAQVYESLKASNRAKLTRFMQSFSGSQSMTEKHSRSVEDYIWKALKSSNDERKTLFYTDEVFRTFPSTAAVVEAASKKKDWIGPKEKLSNTSDFLGLIATVDQFGVLEDCRQAFDEELDADLLEEYFDTVIDYSEEYEDGAPVVLNYFHPRSDKLQSKNSTQILHTPLYCHHFNSMSIIWRVVQGDPEILRTKSKDDYEQKAWELLDRHSSYGIVPETQQLIQREMNNELVRSCSERGAVSVMFQ